MEKLEKKISSGPSDGQKWTMVKLSVYKKTFSGGINVLYLDCGGVYKTAYTS